MILKVTFRFIFCLVLGTYFLSLPLEVFAARSLVISSSKTSIFGDEELTINASSSGFTDGETIYIKGSFYQEGSTNYFGLTKKENEWIKNGDTTLNQRQLKVGEWDNNFVVKSDFTDSGYKGEGEYSFKAGFYYITSGGNLSSVNWSNNSLMITINEPDPTQIPTSPPTNTPIPVNTATPTLKPTITPISPTPSPKALMNISLTPQSKATSTPKENRETKEVLGENESLDSSSEPTPTDLTESSISTENNLAKIFIGLGIILIISCGILVFKTYKEKLINLIWKIKN